jgi:hypothetical protein
VEHIFNRINEDPGRYAEQSVDKKELQEISWSSFLSIPQKRFGIICGQLRHFGRQFISVEMSENTSATIVDASRQVE